MRKISQIHCDESLDSIETSAPQLIRCIGFPETVSVDSRKAQISAAQSHVLVKLLRQRVPPSKRSAIRVIRGCLFLFHLRVYWFPFSPKDESVRRRTRLIPKS